MTCPIPIGREVSSGKALTGAPPTTPGDCIRILGVTTKYLTLLVLMVSRIAMNAKKWSKVVVVVSLLLCGTGTEAIAESYTTNFPLTENPISEGGNWINGLTNGIDWSDV